MSSDPVQTIHRIYQAFGRGDIAAILDCLSPDVHWEAWADNSAQRAGAAHLQARRGRDGAMAFFNVIGGLQFHEFVVLDMIGGASQAAAEIVVDFTVPATGRRVRDEEMHLWTFGADGKVLRFRHYCDTAKHAWVHGLEPKP